MGERENRRELSKDHMARGEKSLQASKMLNEKELYEDAISRAYYAAYHASKAMLISIGEDSRTHRGHQHLLYTHFVKTEIMDMELHKGFADLLNFRADADYGIIPRFGHSEVEQGIDTATNILKFAQKWLEDRYKD